MNFGSELTKNTPLPPPLELLMVDLQTLVLSLPRIHSPLELQLVMGDCAGDWCVETTRCILLWIPCRFVIIPLKTRCFWGVSSQGKGQYVHLYYLVCTVLHHWSRVAVANLHRQFLDTRPHPSPIFFISSCF